MKLKKTTENFIVVVTLVRFSYTFRFSTPPSFQCFSCISCPMKIFYYFLGASHLFGDSFFIFKENTL